MELTMRENVLALVTKYPALKFDYNQLVLTYWHQINRYAFPQSITRRFNELVEDGSIKLSVSDIIQRNKLKELSRKYSKNRK